MTSRDAIAVEIASRTLRALEAGWVRNRLEVRRVLVEPLPDDLDPADPKSVGAWAGRTLTDAEGVDR